jgi:DNA (cytosine-5)-methyltransferase 1
MKRRSGPTVVDLFAGAGLFGAAFESEGFQLLEAVELERAAAVTHAANLNAQLFVGDIAHYEPRGRCDVLIAGPPCQGFSTLGKRRADDPRNRLSLHVARCARTLRPKIVVVENVAPFLESPAAARLQHELVTLDYEIQTFVLNAVDFGVPQRRLRSFTIASKVGSIGHLKARTKASTTVRRAWEGLPAKPDGKNHHELRLPSDLALQRMKQIPPGGDKRDLMQTLKGKMPPSWHRIAGEVTDVWGRMHWESPANTLRTCFLNPSKGRYIHPEQHRMMTIREAARLHSIPDRWRFTGTPYQMARQIGNSVPPALGRVVAASIARQLRLAA